MLYNSILLALTALQVLAQDQYNSDAPSDDTTAIEGSTAEPSPTEAPYVSDYSDGSPTNDGGNNDTSYGTDSSTTAISSAPDDNESTASSMVSSLYTSDASQVGGSTSESSSAPSSASANPEQTTTPPSTPVAWQHIKFKADPSKCLAVFDTSGNANTPVVVVDCFSSGHEAHWSVDVTGANRIISRAFNDTEWCLDSGESEADGQIVYLNKCEDIVHDQLWQYADEHWLVYARIRCLDLELGHTEGGGRLQTWKYTHVNTNQGWVNELAFNANT